MRHLDPVRHMLDVIDACQSHGRTMEDALSAVRILAEGAGFHCHVTAADAAYGLRLCHPDDTRIICVDGTGRTCVVRGGPIVDALRPFSSNGRPPPGRFRRVSSLEDAWPTRPASRSTI